MKGFLILLVTAIVVCVGNRTQEVHKHRHGKNGHKPERDTGSITLKPGTVKNKLFPGYGTNFRYIGEVKNGLDRVTVVTSIPIPKYSDIEIRPIVFNNCTEDLWRHGARTRGYPQYETYDKCNYYYNITVPPVILDGGRDVLLANFHGPRSLKCSSVNGGLAKPAPENTYAVVNREFLCDCQLDVEHASVLRQLSSCSKSSSSKMHMKFTINLAFWEMFKKRSPKSTSNIQPQYAEEVQTFSVDLYDLQIGKLDQPIDLERFIETMDTNGQKISTVEEREAEQPMQKIMPRWLNNVLVMTCTAMTTVLMIIILVLLAKHFKMKALVSMLAIQTVPPPAEAVNLTAAMMSAMIAPDPAIGTKVVCAYPVAVIWQNILGYLVLVYAITQFFRPVTWCKGYKYNKKCALYIFVYDEDHERYSPLKIMSLKGQMHNYRMKYTGEGISLTLVRSWTYDTMTIGWGGVQVMDKSDPINLPATVTVALRHKIMTRRIAQQLGEVQYMLKQGSSWHDITDYYRARKKAVNLRVESGDRGVTSSPKKDRKEKSHKKTKVQEEPVEV